MVRSISSGFIFGILGAVLLPSIALGNVNLQLQTVINPVVVGDTVEIRLIASGTPAAQNIGFVQTILTWDPTKLQLTGFSTSGAFAWESQGFFNDSSGDGLNAPYTGLPANDGNAVFRAQASPPASAPTTGLRVTTFQFTAISTGVNSPITVPTILFSTVTAVLNDDVPFGANVPINTISNTTVTINCTLSSQCNDNNPCTDDACSASQCSFVNDNTNNPNDGLRCNGVEQSCSGGTIIYTPGQGPVDCSGLNTACLLGVCVEPGGSCTTTPINNGGACNDGLFCTLTDTCSAGTCSGTDTPCGGQFCNEAADSCVNCLTNAHCQDAQFCNSQELCVAGNCVQGPDPCPGQLCVEATDTCIDCVSSLDCDDGNFCNGAEQCVSNNCVAGTPPCLVGELCCENSNTCSTQCCVDADCDDGFPCSADVCDLGGSCVNFANPTVCQDTTFCNGIERCVESPVGVFTCQPANTPACPVSEVCCEGTDSCQPDCCSDADCIDAFFCNGNETCLAGVCQPGTPPNCSSFTNDCNVGSCNETLNTCQATPVNNNGSCNDQNVCTYGDKCTNGVCDGCLQGEAGCTPQGLVNLVWDPPSQTALVGSTIQLKLIARSSVAAAQVVDGIDTIISWDPARLQLTPGTGLNPNPADPCTGAGGCPPNTYDWLSSGWPNDCFSDSINVPCSGTPSNDGSAFHTCLSQLSPAAPASATSAGLHATTFKFTVLPGASGSTTVSFNPCFAPDGHTVTRVIGGSAPGTVVTGSLGPPATINIQQCSNNAQCNDTLDCNGIETCVSNSCVPGTPLCSPPTPVCIELSNTCVACTLDSHCSDGVFCNGVEDCSSNNCFPGNPPCTGGLQCDESTDDCVECFTNIECDDGIPCTDDQCLLGDCYNTPVDSVCDDGLYCNGPEVCNEGTGCASTGNPCCDPLACNEVADTCGGGCQASTAVVVGSRYVAVTPAPGPNPVSILFTGDPADSSVSCLSLYVQANGTLGTTPFSQTPALWGTTYVRDLELRPGKKFTVCTGCVSGFSAKVPITMWRWGDADNSGVVSLDDILCVLNGFGGVFGTPPTFCTNYSTDLIGPGCVPELNITLDDILQVLSAFGGASVLPPLLCPNVCP